MIVSRVIFVLLLSLLAFTYGKLVPPPAYTLNLSLPASEIWAGVAKDFAPKFPTLFSDIESKLPEELLKEVSAITPDLDKYLFPQFVEEMKGIAKYGNVSLERIVLLNLLYDIHAYDQSEEIPSISVVVNSNQDVNNPIISGQTIAWAYSPLLRDMVINVDTHKSAQYILQGTTFAGMVGLLSGVTAADFSAAYAERKSNSDETWKTIFNCLRSGDNYTTLSFQIRHKLQYDVLGQQFIAAVLEFSSSLLVAPSYLMLGGWDAGQGVLITRDRFAAYDKAFLFSNQTDWYVVGTNKMPWAQPPDPQKKLLMAELEKAGKNMDVPMLVKILQLPQLYNNHTAFVVATTPCYWGPYTSLVYYPDD